MKTSEFIEYVKGNWFTTWEQGDNVINIGGIMKVHTNRQLIEFEKRTASSEVHLTLIKKAVEYTETPLEEREEEKKYFLRVPFTDDLYLNYHKALKSYAFSDKNPSKSIQTMFTLKEIYDMPFDMNFFIKEVAK